MLSLEGLKILRPVHRITVLIFLTALVALFTMPCARTSRPFTSFTTTTSAWVDTNLSALVWRSQCQSRRNCCFQYHSHNQLHVYYLGYDEVERVDHVHSFTLTGSSWSDDDLTALTGGVPGSTEGGLSGFQSVTLVMYISSGRIPMYTELSYVDNWVDSDLTVLTRAVFGYPYEIAHSRLLPTTNEMSSI